MAAVRYSKVLTAIIDHINDIVGNGSNQVTAEKLIASAIDLVMNDKKYAGEEQLKPIIELEKQVSLEKAEKELMNYISEKQKRFTYADTIYYQNKRNEALEKTKEEGSAELSASTLFSCILSDPNETIALCLNISNEDYSNDTMINEDAYDGIVAHDENWVSDDADDFDYDISQDEMVFVDEDGEPIPDEQPNPMSVLTEKVIKTQDILLSSIYGQDNAVGVFTQGYFQAELLAMTDKSRTRPRATFLFAGPPGVGKTFLAEMAAKTLGLPFMRFDMSEYSHREANLQFCGSDKVYKNGREGNVTGFVDKNPECILLFDEIEKADLSVIHLFLQMLDAGRLRDTYKEKEISFTDTIIIITTNAGRPLYENDETGDFSDVPRKVILKALQNDIDPRTNAPFFPAAICSRFASGNVVMFNHIAAHSLREIARNEVLRRAEKFGLNTGFKLKIDEMVYTSLLFAEGGTADARTIRGRAENFFNSEVYELFRLVNSKKTDGDISGIETIKIGVELPKDSPELTALFKSSEKYEALLFSSGKTAARCRKNAKECKLLNAQNIEDAERILRTHDISMILVDLTFGRKNRRQFLNVEDVESAGRDFLHYARNNHDTIPLYLLETEELNFSSEEKFSFMRQGVRGVITLSNDGSFDGQIAKICSELHQQASMINLAKANKVVTYQTAQTLSRNGKQADIILFDFDMITAVDAEDSGNILSSVSKPNVSFDKVIGANDAKTELKYFVSYLKNPKKFMGTGVKAPRGVLLYGPPGTGKTMLAKAMASESDVTFITAEGNQFLSKWVGESAERVHEIFRTARKYAPSILFIDEIDAVAKTRGDDGASAAADQVLTAFLTEMDGFNSDPTKPVFVLAATNFDVQPGGRNSLDPALMRRFDRKVYIDLPDREDRIKYMRMKLDGSDVYSISPEKLENIAIRSTGRSLADLESVFELALRSAIRDGDLKVTDEVLEEAFETYFSGDSKEWDISQLERVARHEAGHAFLCWDSGETPSYVTVVARANHGGYMQHADNEGKAVYTKDELLANIRTSLGGRASELVYYGEKDGVSTGAGSDLVSATRLAKRIICTYGMDEEFGLAVIDEHSASHGEMSSRVHSAVNDILSRQMEIAVKAISDNKKAIDALVEQLVSKNHLSGDEVDAVFKANCPEKAKA